MYKIFIANAATATAIGTLMFLSVTVDAADSYDVISKKNLFRPDRQEWILDTPDSRMVDKKVDTSKLELFGTIIIGDKRSALIRDKNTTSKDATRSSKSRSKSKSSRGKVDKKAELYALGDYIGGYVISKIEEKRVVLDYYGEEEVLYLHEGKEPTRGEVTPLEVEKPRRTTTKKTSKKSVRDRTKKNQDLRKQAKEMEEQLASGEIPEALANSPFMSQENMKKLLDFNKEIMADLKESGGELDQTAIKDKVEQFRERFMNEMGGMMEQ
jgi:hypothetical protein